MTTDYHFYSWENHKCNTVKRKQTLVVTIIFCPLKYNEVVYIIGLKYKSKPVDDVEYEEENREGDEEELVNPETK